jgi:outer membrane protein
MKILSVLLLVFLFGPNIAEAQKFGYIDSEFILSKMPDYQKAQDEINTLSSAWEKEIADMQTKVEALYSSYNAEQVLLTEEMKAQRLDEIKKKETELKDYNKKVFGFEGLFFLKKQELIRPLQDKIWDAVEKVAKSNRLAIIFDKANGTMVMIYTDPRHDYTDFVLEDLGLGDTNDKIK